MVLCDASRVVEQTIGLILDIASKHITQRILRTKKCSHPWLSNDIVHLVAAKHADVGTPGYEDRVKARSAGILAEYYNYASNARQKLFNTLL